MWQGRYDILSIFLALAASSQVNLILFINILKAPLSLPCPGFGHQTGLSHEIIDLWFFFTNRT
jgi:hypothetical protein